MIFWLAASLLTAVMVALLFRPLLRPIAQATVQSTDVYKAQLTEIDRELANGLLTEGDANAARTEISRRLLRASNEAIAKTPERAGSRPAALVVASFVILAALGGYLWLGAPGLPGQPFASRDLGTESAERLAPAAQELERRLEAMEDPADRAIFLGDAFASLGGLDEAMEAYLTALGHRPDDPDIFARLGETQVVRAQGLVTAEAKVWFERALAALPLHPAANYYLALFDYQQGNFPAAETRLNDLLATAGEGAEWRGQIAEFLANVQQAQARNEEILGLDETDRDQMIREMVEGLAAGLEASPDDFDGWLRLANAYAVLGEGEAAQEALAHASALAEGVAVLEARVAEVAEILSQN